MAIQDQRQSTILWTETCPACGGTGGRHDVGGPVDTPYCYVCNGAGEQAVVDPITSWYPIHLVNLTKHDIVLMDDGQRPILTIPPSGTEARCEPRRHPVGLMLGYRWYPVKPTGRQPAYPGVPVQINRTEFGPVMDLPDPKRGTAYIVSRLVAEACPERHDLYISDDTVRDDAGHITGARALAQV